MKPQKTSGHKRPTTSLLSSAIVVSLLSSSLCSHAAVITTTLQGTVGFTGFGPTTGFQTGNAVTLSFTYDTSTLSSMPNPMQRVYDPGNNGSLFSMSLQITSNDPGIGIWNAQTTGGNFSVTKTNAGSKGQLQLSSQVAPSPFFTFDTGTPLAPFSFKLDSTEDVIGDQIDSGLNAPSTYDLSKWSQSQGILYFDNGAREVQMNFTSQVPEPSTSLLFGIASILGVLRRRR